MKKPLLLILCAFALSYFASAQSYFYGDNGALALTPDPNSQVIHFEHNNDFHAFLRQVPFDWTVTKQIEKYNMVVIESDGIFPNDLADQDGFEEIEVKHQTPIFRLDDGFAMWLGYGILFEPKPGLENEVNEVVRQKNGKLFVDSYGMHSAQLDNPMATLEISNQLIEMGLVNWAHPDFYANHTKRNDPRYNRQFQMHNTGQTIGGVTGTNDIDCDAPEAWAITTGDSNLIVAVIDDGVEDHPDIVDGNGDSRLIDGFTPANNGDGTPIGSNSHGMACAGIIGATHNNSIGVRGLAPGVDIISVDIFQGSETTSDLAEAFNWARLQGADVMSNSWGYNSCTLSLSALNSAIQNATNLGRGGLGSVVLFASGNSYLTCVEYPADLSYVMGVGAVTSLGAISNYSNEGPTLDIVAPSSSAPGQTGAGVSTTDRPGSAGYSSGDYTNGFGGTSAACPLVAGAAALVLSMDATLEEDEVRTILEESATDMGASGFDNTFGHGRVNAHQAVLLATPVPQDCSGSIADFPYSQGFENGLGEWTQYTNDDLDWIENSGGTPSSNTGPSSADEGSQYLHIEASFPNYPSKSATIQSPCFDLSALSNPELNFSFHMFGASMGSLTVEISTDNGVNWSELWTITGNQGNNWNEANVSLAAYASETGARLRFTGVTGTSYTGDVSIDAIEIDEMNDSACDEVVSNFPYNEGFETTSFNWNQTNDDDINWTRRTGTTPSSSTGPTGASEGAYYMYIEASSPNYPAKTANLESDCFDLSGATSASLSFDYHMYGSNMGSLKVQAKIGNGAWADLWTLSGNQGNSWKQAVISLNDYAGNSEVILRFSGETGVSFRSDICIDNMQLEADDTDTGNDCPTLNFDNYNVIAYGGSQDAGNSQVTENGARLDIDNNAWKSIEFPYTVTANTMLSFEFRSTQEGEIHGIGFDTDQNISSQYTFKVHGTQNWGILNYDNYSGSNWTTYTIAVGDAYTGSFSRLFFVGDNDNGAPGDNSSFRNISVYEDGDCNPSISTLDNTSEAIIYGHEDEFTSLFQVFPNPANDQVTLLTNGLNDAEVRIIDITGKTQMAEVINSNNQRFDISELANGIYMIQISSGNNILEVQKLVITD